MRERFKRWFRRKDSSSSGEVVPGVAFKIEMPGTWYSPKIQETRRFQIDRLPDGQVILDWKDYAEELTIPFNNEPISLSELHLSSAGKKTAKDVEDMVRTLGGDWEILNRLNMSLPLSWIILANELKVPFELTFSSMIYGSSPTFQGIIVPTDLSLEQVESLLAEPSLKQLDPVAYMVLERYSGRKIKNQNEIIDDMGSESEIKVVEAAFCIYFDGLPAMEEKLLGGCYLEAPFSGRAEAIHTKKNNERVEIKRGSTEGTLESKIKELDGNWNELKELDMALIKSWFILANKLGVSYLIVRDESSGKESVADFFFIEPESIDGVTFSRDEFILATRRLL